MKSPLPYNPEDRTDTRLDALFRIARSAPLPRLADRLAIGFATRVEARLQAAAETVVVSRLLRRWVAGLGACAAVVVAAASLVTGANGFEAAATDSSFQSDWDSYTEVPDGWPP
jgi:hypothetical protein